MKTKTLHTFSLFLIICFCIGAVCVGVESVNNGDGPEPLPWWMRVEEFQGLALKWLTAISIVVGAVIAAVFGVMAQLRTKMNELKERQDRLSDGQKTTQTKLVDLASQLPPPGDGKP